MRVAELCLENWMRYVGEHRLKLGPQVYGVVGRFADNNQRSNWSGKTALLEAVRFALYGAHRFAQADGWISEGASKGQVLLFLSTGVVITRSRQRGHAGRLEVQQPDGTKASGEAAQGLIDKMTGLDLRDFEASCWFGQKEFGRFILSRPSERLELVQAWLRLDPLVDATGNATSRASAAADRVSDAQRNLLAFESELVAIIDPYKAESSDMRSPGEHLDSAMHYAEGVRAAAQGVLDQLGNEAQQAAARAVARHKHEEFLRLVQQGREARKSQDELQAALDCAMPLQTAKVQAEQARQAYQQAASHLKQTRKLAEGEFDGACPLTGSACPAAADVRAFCQGNGDRVKAAYEGFDRAEAADRRAQGDLQAVQSAHKALDMARDERLRVAALYRAAVTRGEDKPVPDDDNEAVNLEPQRQAVARAEATLDAIQRDRLRVAKVLDLIAGSREAVRAAKEEQALATAAAQVLRQSQRVIAEQALGEIEADANALLRDAGIDLVVSVRWAREGSGLATHCETCGAPFPGSAKVRACQRCGAARGPKMIERLDVTLSDRSGAAEDLGGAAVQLAASAWLRRARGVAWAVAFLDEPYGALDAANRQAFSSHLLAMLRGRYEQAFVVAHHQDVLDTLPGRVIVQADEYGSKPEVLS